MSCTPGSHIVNGSVADSDFEREFDPARARPRYAIQALGADAQEDTDYGGQCRDRRASLGRYLRLENLHDANATVWPEHYDSCTGSSASGECAASHNDASDSALIAAIAHADQAAFRQLHARYFGRIRRFLRAVPYRSDLLGDEIANDTLWVVWQRAAQFRGESKVSSWIMGIARKLSSNRLRAIRRRGNNDPWALYEQEYEPFAQTELAEWVCEALAGLPAEQRTVVELFYGLDQSCEEISRAVNCPIGTVKTRLFHGRRKLRELLPRLAGVS